MRSFALPIVFAALRVVAAATAATGITDADIPQACKAVCNPLVELSSACMTNGSSGQAEADCICKNTSFDVKGLGSLCAICCTQTNALSDDLKAISSECGFTQTAYNQASASKLAATVVVTATKPGGQVVTGSTPTATGAVNSSSSKGQGMAAPVQTYGAIMMAAMGAGFQVL